ncbi:MAG: hypothetical protein IPH28_03095 [Cytophagaceae bacterium]|nr:hypothetical protein [Cytophagaceae bacterium]
MKFRTLFFLYFIFLYHLSFSQNWNIELLRKINLERNPSFDDGFRKITNSITYTDIGTPVILFTVAAIRHDSVGKRNPGDVLAGAIIGSGTAFLTHKINYWLAKK